MPKGYDWAAAPLETEAGPCGPDLEATDDPDFVEWYFTSLGQLPERYVVPGPGGGADRAFDPRSVDIKTEKSHADTILLRTRDLRVLTLMARWEVLAGRAPEAAEAMEAVAALLEAFPAQVHPTAPSDRREALLDLADPATVLLPLQHLNLAGAQEVSLRRMRVATGEAQARSYETGLDGAVLLEELSRPGNRAAVQASVDAIDRMRRAATRIGVAARAPEAGSLTPDLSALGETLDAIRAILAGSVPDMLPATPDAPEPDTAGPTDAPGDPQPDASPAGAVAPPASAAGARAMLEACERYFRLREPSSAAVLLVTQARLLVGRPLMEAIETLMPADAPRTTVTLGASGFQLSAERLRSLSGDTSLTLPEAPEPDAPPPDIAPPGNGAEAAALLAAVETYYARHERSSPVPMLLSRARATIGKDFQALIAELVPPAPK